ncbi:hypothetical protein [Nostoc sp. CCY 9925]
MQNELLLMKVTTAAKVSKVFYEQESNSKKLRSLNIAGGRR